MSTCLVKVDSASYNDFNGAIEYLPNLPPRYSFVSTSLRYNVR